MSHAVFDTYLYFKNNNLCPVFYLSMLHQNKYVWLVVGHEPQEDTQTDI